MNQLEIDGKDISLLIGGLQLLKRETIANLLGISLKRIVPSEGKDKIYIEIYNRTQRLLDNLEKARAAA